MQRQPSTRSLLCCTSPDVARPGRLWRCGGSVWLQRPFPRAHEPAGMRAHDPFSPFDIVVRALAGHGGVFSFLHWSRLTTLVISWRELANAVAPNKIAHVARGITATEVHRRLPWRHYRRDDSRQRAILTQGELPPAGARRVERVDLRGHDLPLLPIYRRCLAHTLDRFARCTRGGPHPPPGARDAKVVAH